MTFVYLEPKRIPPGNRRGDRFPAWLVMKIENHTLKKKVEKKKTISALTDMLAQSLNFQGIGLVT
jgi:hypothetical protein